jgi:hypothetical protein
VWKEQRERLQQVKQEDDRKRQVAMLLLVERKRAIVASAASKKRDQMVVSAPLDVKHKPAAQILQELGADPQLIAMMTAKKETVSRPASPPGGTVKSRPTGPAATVSPRSLTSSDPTSTGGGEGNGNGTMLSPKALKLLGIEDESKMNKKGVQPTIQRVGSAMVNKLGRRSTAPAAVPDRGSDGAVDDVMASLLSPPSDDEGAVDPSSDMAKILAADTLKFSAVAGSSAPSQYQMLPGSTTPLPGTPNAASNYAPLAGLSGAPPPAGQPGGNYAPLGVTPLPGTTTGGNYGVIAGFGDAAATRTALPGLPPIDASNYQSVAGFGQPQLPGMPHAQQQGYGELPEGMQGNK